jgi:hypothetical protein
VDGCQHAIHIYKRINSGSEDGWYWTVLHSDIVSNKGIGNVIVGNDRVASLKEAKLIATKFAFIQFLRQIDPTLFKKEVYGNSTFCRF